MTGQPTVSVIIPNYNYAASLGLCIQSVQQQDYPAIQIIVVDDCSTDNSVEVARDLGVTVFSTGRNSGVATARNLGVEHAQGEILFFLDSDVALSPGALRRAVDLLGADPALGALCGTYEADPLIRDSLVEECRCLQAYYWRLSSVGTVSFLFTAICAMRAEVFRTVGPFNPRLRQTEEVDYGQRLTRDHEVVLTSEVRGSHDDDHELGALVRKIFTRGRLRIPLYARRRRFAKGFETPARGWASVASLLAVCALVAPWLLGPVGWILPGALLLVSLLCDLGMYRFVRARRGTAFLLAFAGVQYVFNLTVALSIAAGVAQWICSGRFRRMYDQEPAAPVRPVVEAV
jgi:glycosyltransferase involved in cell wall biosynthesis